MKSVCVALFVLAWSATTVSAATMAIWGDDGTGLSPNLTIEGDKPFDVVVTLDSDGSGAKAAEWVMTELRMEYPGLFAIAVQKLNNTPLDLGANELGEYLMAFGTCSSTSDRTEMLRITYRDVAGAVGTKSVLMTLRGFEAGDTQPSSFGGQPGFVDCGSPPRGHTAPMGGNENGGALCVNCYSPPEREATMTELKSQY